MNQALGLAPAGGEINVGGGGLGTGLKIGQLRNQVARIVDACFGFGGARFRAAAQPLQLCAHAILERALALRLGVQEFGLLFQKRAVVPRREEHVVGINPA